MQKTYFFRWGTALVLSSAFLLSACAKSAPPPPYANRSASWLAQKNHTDALKTELKWCAKHNPSMTKPVCATAKKGYAMIGGQWNPMTIRLLRGGSA